MSNNRSVSRPWLIITLGSCYLFSSTTAGCGNTPNQPAAVKSTISWEEFQKMDEEQQRDPYVLDNLDDAAKKKLEERSKKRR